MHLILNKFLTLVLFTVKDCLAAVSDVSDLTWRECKHVEAFQKRAEGDTYGTINAWEEILLHYPTGK